ncbi:sulfite exporter TauE/SafE family protein [Sedimentitalea sp. JM2-8]|uniref:Probable membrane transporter protein n=1 Tax=Sedimentitalea xiamensis TaxID=3050037 RepID=A0ABT7FGQ2_9RHOB|nr:sulfite exporter TauE/SafE family protein [Sedimentitalea xiamensis]MDK3074133.1 sulfite exporter TauE/SafE family protein [Sedimentitalea xiamensis]
MPDILAQVLAMPGLGWLIAAALVAGLVRGFSGFGTAMIYLPVAAQVLPPLWAIVTLVVMDIFGPVPNLPRAFRDAHRRDLVLLIGGAFCLLPVGLSVLSLAAPELYRYGLSTVSLVLVACLALGLRYHGVLYPPLVAGIGAFAGFLGGLIGVPGPPVILFYMASTLPVQVVRANVLLFLFFFDFLLLGLVALRGDLSGFPVVLGLLLALPNIAGNVIGAMVFNPARTGLYRAMAYAIVAVSAIAGLPAWD